MALITGNFDDSQTTGDVWVVAGYLGYANQWDLFEQLWRAALAKHGVPYFHMKEMMDPSGPFAKWLPAEEHQPEVAAFLGDLVAAIRQSGLRIVSSGVWLDDLAKFNADKGLALEPYPLAAYACLGQIPEYYQRSPVAAVFDRVEKVDDKLRKAWVYARSDPRFYPDGVCDCVSSMPLPKPLTARDVPAMQAADFIAWEVRKALVNMKEWQRLPDRPRGSRKEQWQHYLKWSRETQGKETLFRKSFGAAVTDVPAHSVVWARDQLEHSHGARLGVWTLEDAARLRS